MNDDAVTDALAVWREAERQRSDQHGSRNGLDRAMWRARARYVRLSAQQLEEAMVRLKEAQQRRIAAPPDSPELERAGQEELLRAAEVWRIAHSREEELRRGR